VITLHLVLTIFLKNYYKKKKKKALLATQCPLARIGIKVTWYGMVPVRPMPIVH
jgi:hypothetical protein